MVFLKFSCVYSTCLKQRRWGEDRVYKYLERYPSTICDWIQLEGGAKVMGRESRITYTSQFNWINEWWCPQKKEDEGGAGLVRWLGIVKLFYTVQDLYSHSPSCWECGCWWLSLRLSQECPSSTSLLPLAQLTLCLHESSFWSSDGGRKMSKCPTKFLDRSTQYSGANCMLYYSSTQE